MTSTAQGPPQLTPGRIRSAWRDTFIYSSDDRNTVLGGLLASEGMSNRDLYSIVEIICIFTDTFHIQDDRGLVENDAYALTPRDYYIVTDGSITVTNEIPLFHQISLQTATHVAAFTHAVRNRDQRCVIMGKSAVVSGVTF
ncbi:hypothetical protein HOY80DRAFT_1035529 [Tuber brumale]|nr:hypothetical protein HOY80DRAFT_1035529 [Tuber brumale]